MHISRSDRAGTRPQRESCSSGDANATADLGRLEQDNHRLVVRAQALVELVVDRIIEGEELKLPASYGDLSDCRKIYFGVTAEPTHRIVYRLLTDDEIEVAEVVMIEQREEGPGLRLFARCATTCPVAWRNEGATQSGNSSPAPSRSARVPSRCPTSTIIPANGWARKGRSLTMFPQVWGPS